MMILDQKSVLYQILFLRLCSREDVKQITWKSDVVSSYQTHRNNCSCFFYILFSPPPFWGKKHTSSAVLVRDCHFDIFPPVPRFCLKSPAFQHIHPNFYFDQQKNPKIMATHYLKLLFSTFSTDMNFLKTKNIVQLNQIKYFSFFRIYYR